MNGDFGVLLWWYGMSLVAVFNLTAWTYLAWRWLRQAPEPRAERQLRRLQFALSFVFATGCAFRSFLPRAEAQRIVLYDAWVSNAALGRSVATLAELCFMAQWALFLYSLTPTSARWLRVSAWLPLMLIGLAEVFSWYTALTTNFVGSVVEESLWLLATALCIVRFIKLLPGLPPATGRWAQLAIAVGIGYCAFLACVDVPMYWARWRADEARGHVPLTLTHGLEDSLQRWVVTRRNEDWQDEMPWMSLYFSVGVWMSIGLTQVAWRSAPRRSETLQPELSEGAS